MNNCKRCGAELKEDAKFCENCGAAVQEEQAAPQPAKPLPLPGFSSRVHDPEILAAVKKNRNASKIFALILIPLPLLVTLIYSLVSDKLDTKQALIYGGIISAVFLILAIRTLIKNRAKNTYEAVVTEKRMRERSTSHGDQTDYYTEYVVYAKTPDGKKKKIVERSGGMVVAYDYLNVGDRFKYHPQFTFPYELFDKAKAPYLVCVACGTHNDVTDDRCKKCSVPLLK